MTGPIAFFLPAIRFPTVITRTNPIVITTSVPHLFLTGLIVRMIIPPYYGMTQLDGLSGEVVVIDATNFSLPIDSTLFDAFVIPTGLLQVNAQIIPYGENALILTQAERNVLPI